MAIKSKEQGIAAFYETFIGCNTIMRIKIKSLYNEVDTDSMVSDKIYITLDHLVNEEFDIPCNTANTKAGLEDAITQLLIGSKKLRYGNYPSTSCVTSITELIRTKIRNSEPIPIVVPMGPHKTIINEQIDLAEIYALKTLSALNARVSCYYPAGLIFYLREEDITGWFLSGTSPDVRESIEQYLNNFNQLIKMLGYEKFIIPFRESQIANFEDVLALINVYSTPIQNYINDTQSLSSDNYQKISSYRVLNALGWKGEIPLEQRLFYQERYTKHYPHKTKDEINKMMVDYLAISFAKSQLGALVPGKNKQDYIQLTFAPPVPGIHTDIVSRRIHYRTLPTNISRMHLPFWRAKGFLITTEGTVKPTIHNWYSPHKFHQHEIQLTARNDSLILRADIANL